MKAQQELVVVLPLLVLALLVEPKLLIHMTKKTVIRMTLLLLKVLHLRQKLQQKPQHQPLKVLLRLLKRQHRLPKVPLRLQQRKVLHQLPRLLLLKLQLQHQLPKVLLRLQKQSS
ncbi:MAG: hypothetical protein U0936_21330 [Planctomycetaceae bacterium]